MSADPGYPRSVVTPSIAELLAEVAALKHRIRLARDVVKSPAFIERGWYRKELNDLLDLRRPLRGRR